MHDRLATELIAVPTLCHGKYKTKVPVSNVGFDQISNRVDGIDVITALGLADDWQCEKRVMMRRPPCFFCTARLMIAAPIDFNPSAALIVRS